MRFLEALNLQEFHQRGYGTPDDFGRRFYKWFGYCLQRFEGDPILREHFATWLADKFKMRNGDSFVKKVVNGEFNNGWNDKPEFQSRHYWFMATLLKEIQNRYFWQYAYKFFTENATSHTFKSDVFAKESQPRRLLDDHG